MPVEIGFTISSSTNCLPGEPVLDQLLQPVHDTVAVRMLRAMGWRAGQGTGDRLRREEKRRAADQHRVYGCYMPPDMRPVSISKSYRRLTLQKIK